MKRLSLLFKETSENSIKKNLKQSDSVFIVRYSGLSSPDITALRRSLTAIKADLFVVKNSVARRAFKSSSFEDLGKFIEGPCGLIFIKEEPVNVCRVLCDFSRNHENLKLEGGFLKDRIVEKKDIERLSRLPSKEVLRAQAVMTLNAPLVKLVIVLNQTLRKFVYCLDQIKCKKDK